MDQSKNIDKNSSTQQLSIQKSRPAKYRANFKMIINTLSGSKLGSENAKRAMEVFESEGIKIERIYVGEKNRNHLRDCDMKDVDGIVIVGGDGTINKAINEILTRNDSKKIPIGIIPSGTGNSLANDLYGGRIDIEEAAKKISRMRVKKVDVSLIEEGSKSTYFMSMVGLVNVAKRAENFRFMGSYRYKIASILESLFPSFEYVGRLVINNNETYHGRFPFLIICNTEHISQHTIACPGAKLDDGKIGISFVNDSINFLQLLSVENRLSDGSHISHPNVVYRDDVRHISFHTESVNSINVDGEVDYVHTPFHLKVLPQHYPLFI